jgi:hypothetical protein
VKKRNTAVIFIRWQFASFKLYSWHSCYEIIPHLGNESTQEILNLKFAKKHKFLLIPGLLWIKITWTYLCPDSICGTPGHSGARPHTCKSFFFNILIFCLSSRRWFMLCLAFIPYLVAANTCGGGVEYLHRDPASRRRRRKGQSQNWDSKLWSRDPRDSDPWKTALARASSTHKRQTRPFVREGAPQKQDRNCKTIINIWSWAPDGARHQDLLIDGPSVAM